MKSKLHLRKNTTDSENHPTDVELEITDQKVTSFSIIKQGLWDASNFPKVDSSVKVHLLNWCKPLRSLIKLPSEPESAYRRIENMMELGDMLGCGRVD